MLVIIAYDSVDEAVAIANDTEYGLGAHVQGQDLVAARAVAARIRAGQVHINNPPWSPEAPFGGYKRSGNGREYGVEGLEGTSRSRPSSATWKARRPLPLEDAHAMNTCNPKEQRP